MSSTPTPSVRQRLLPVRRLGVAAGWTAVLLVGVLLLSGTTSVLPLRSLSVQSGSMAPSLPVGSVLLSTPARTDDIRVGDVITFTHPEHSGQLVTHRVVTTATTADGPSFRTKGDANAAVDLWSVTPGEQVWRVQGHLPVVGTALTFVRVHLVLLVAWAGIALLAGSALRRLLRGASATTTLQTATLE